MQRDTAGTAPAFRRDYAGASGGAMSLVPEKCLLDWASQIAQDRKEDFVTVCATLLGDVISGALVTRPPLAEAARQYLRDIDSVGKIRARGPRSGFTDDPQYPGYWLVRLIVREAEINRWLSKLAALTKGILSKAKKEPHGKPGPKPAKRAKIAEKMFDDLSSKRRTPTELRADTLQALVAHYGGSPNTANAARIDALSRFSELQSSRSDEL